MRPGTSRGRLFCSAIRGVVMVRCITRAAVLALFLAPLAKAQLNGLGQQLPPTGTMHPGSTTSMNAFDVDTVDFWFTAKSAEQGRNRAEQLTDTVSKLDLKAP